MCHVPSNCPARASRLTYGAGWTRASGPPERRCLPWLELAGEYEVARGTVARVLAKLADEGLVRIVPRWGTLRA